MKAKLPLNDLTEEDLVGEEAQVLGKVIALY